MTLGLNKPKLYRNTAYLEIYSVMHKLSNLASEFRVIKINHKIGKIQQNGQDMITNTTSAQNKIKLLDVLD